MELQQIAILLVLLIVPVMWYLSGSGSSEDGCCTGCKDEAPKATPGVYSKSEFITVPKDAKTVKDLAERNEDDQFEFTLSAKKNLSPDTIQLTFKFPNPEWTIGATVSQHLRIFNKPDCEPPCKPYTSISPINQKGSIDFVIKVYEKTEEYDEPKLSQYLNTLKVGEKVRFSPPFSKMSYLGDGNFRLQKTIVNKTKIGLIAGGTGITPIYQIMQAMHLAGDGSCDVKFLYSNKTTKDVLIEEQLKKIDREMDNIDMKFTITR
jgi:NAD(P)H-flavin reductase